jgi:hypothetical protein
MTGRSPRCARDDELKDERQIAAMLAMTKYKHGQIAALRSR